MSAPARRPSTGYALVLTGATLLVVNAGVSRVVMRAGVDPGLLTTVRVTGSALGFALIALAVRRSALRLPRGREIAPVCLLGIVGVAGVQWTYNVAIDRIPLGIALLLEYLAPVLVVLWARFVQHTPVHRRMWISVAMTLVGLAVVAQVWDGVAFDVVGIVAGLGAAVCFAVYFLVGEHGVGTDDPLRVILWAFVAAALAMNVVRPVGGLDGLGERTSLLGALAHIHLPLWALVVWVIVLGTLVPFFLVLLAMQYLPATIVTIAATLEPVGATILGWAWFGESLDPVQVVGAVMVVLGICLAQTARTPHPEAVVPEVAT